MSANSPEWLPSWLAQPWHWFDEVSALANFLQITGTVIAIVSAVGSGLYVVLRRKLKHQGAVIERLREDISRREQAMEEAEARAKRLERRAEKLNERLASPDHS